MPFRFLAFNSQLHAGRFSIGSSLGRFVSDPTSRQRFVGGPGNLGFPELDAVCSVLNLAGCADVLFWGEIVPARAGLGVSSLPWKQRESTVEVAEAAYRPALAAAGEWLTAFEANNKDLMSHAVNSAWLEWTMKQRGAVLVRRLCSLTYLLCDRSATHLLGRDTDAFAVAFAGAHGAYSCAVREAAGIAARSDQSRTLLDRRHEKSRGQKREVEAILLGPLGKSVSKNKLAALIAGKRMVPAKEATIRRWITELSGGDSLAGGVRPTKARVRKP